MSWRWVGTAGARLAIGLLWLLHWLPLPVLAFLGQGLGALLWRLARSRRHVCERNLALCFPEKSEAERQQLAHEHFLWMGRSILERGLLWFAPEERLLRLMQVEGDLRQAERSEEPVMWLLPHFVGLEWAAPALLLAARLPCLATGTPQAATTRLTAVETLSVWCPSPPVPQTSMVS